MDQLYCDIRQDTLARINQISDMEQFDLTKIKKGVVSVHARWSGLSVKHGKSILSLLDTPEMTEVEIYIIDIDSIKPEKQIVLMGKVCHGYFESVWVENGKVEYCFRDGNRSLELNKFKDYLKKKINE